MNGTLTLDVGAGEHPDPEYEIHVDMLPLPDIEVVCAMDHLPFADHLFARLRANDVLEHQSWELIPSTLHEWARVLQPNADVFVQVPDSLLLAQRWVRGEMSTGEANYFLLGGHSQRPAHQGAGRNNVPLWLFNAHHAMFEPDSLTAALSEAGFVDIAVVSDGGSNLMCTCRRSQAPTMT